MREKRGFKDPWAELEKKVSFLKCPTSYPGETLSVEAIETHMSWVFVTHNEAYKLKKPVHFTYLNLEEVEDRKTNTEKEIEVNQKLSPGVYLGKVPLYEKGNSFFLGEMDSQKAPVDWLVKMRAIPKELTLAQEIKNQKINWPRFDEACERLMRFYLEEKPISFKGEEYRDYFEEMIKDNFKILLRPKYHLNSRQVSHIHEEQLNFIFSFSQLLESRAREGKIIEAHGDLRPEHFCLTSPPVFIDRIEFDDQLRRLDPLDELGNLAMECEFLGNFEVGEKIFLFYEKIMKEKPSKELINFYQSFRASLRAKLCILHLEDKRVKNKEIFSERAKNYLNLAETILDKQRDKSVEVHTENLLPPSFSSL